MLLKEYLKEYSKKLNLDLVEFNEAVFTWSDKMQKLSWGKI